MEQVQASAPSRRRLLRPRRCLAAASSQSRPIPGLRSHSCVVGSYLRCSRQRCCCSLRLRHRRRPSRCSLGRQSLSHGIGPSYGETWPVPVPADEAVANLQGAPHDTSTLAVMPYADVGPLLAQFQTEARRPNPAAHDLYGSAASRPAGATCTSPSSTTSRPRTSAATMPAGSTSARSSSPTPPPPRCSSPAAATMSRCPSTSKPTSTATSTKAPTR